MNQWKVVTGISSGLGLSLVSLLNKQQKKVIGITRDRKKTEKALQKRGVNISSEHCCVLIEHNVAEEGLAEKIQKTVPEGDIIQSLVCNAAMLLVKNLEAITRDDFIELYLTNVYGVIHSIQSCLPFMKERISNITIVGSMGGIPTTQKFPGLLLYSSSKGALTILTEVLAEELKSRQIHVNQIAPGSIGTEMLSHAFPNLTAQFSPEEVAQYISKFIEHDAYLMNGKTIPLARLSV